MSDSHKGIGVGETQTLKHEVLVYRVMDHEDKDFEQALVTLYPMIDPDDRQATPGEIREQLRVAHEKRANQDYQFDDCHFVAKKASQICGYMQLYFHPAEKFAIIGGFAIRASLSLGHEDPRVASIVCEMIADYLQVDPQFAGCDRFFLELDDPRDAADGRKRKRALNRIELFEGICGRCGVYLRFFDFPYLQARLGVVEDWPKQEKPCLLGYVSRRADHVIDGDVLRHVLGLIYTRLNLEGVYDDDHEKYLHYGSYLNVFCAQQCARVRATVRLLTCSEIQTRTLLQAGPGDMPEAEDGAGLLDGNWLLVSQANKLLRFPDVKQLYKFAEKNPDKLRLRPHPTHERRRLANASDVARLAVERLEEDEDDKWGQTPAAESIQEAVSRAVAIRVRRESSGG